MAASTPATAAATTYSDRFAHGTGISPMLWSSAALDSTNPSPRPSAAPDSAPISEMITDSQRTMART